MRRVANALILAVELAVSMMPALASAAVSALDQTANATDNSVLNSTTATIVGSQAIARVKAGVSGTTYKITFLVTLSDSSVLEEDILMVVKDR